jgi:hypothetical protein
MTINVYIAGVVGAIIGGTQIVTIPLETVFSR